MSGRPDWTNDALLAPWRRGKLELPFTTSERTAAEQRRRAILIAAVLGAAIFVIIFALLVAAGLVPEIHADPRVHSARPPDPWFPYEVSGGAALIGVAVFAFLAGPLVAYAPLSLGRPWTLTATEDGLSIVDSDGRTAASGPWADWRLDDYESAVLAKGVPVITVLVLALGEARFRLPLLSLRHQRRMLRAVAQRVAA